MERQRLGKYKRPTKRANDIDFKLKKLYTERNSLISVIYKLYTYIRDWLKFNEYIESVSNKSGANIIRFAFFLMKTAVEVLFVARN